MKISDFATRQRANEGEKMFLSLPDGTRTKEYLIVRGVDSDAYNRARSEASRRMFSLKDDEDPSPVVEENRLSLMTSLVVGWSLEEEFSEAHLRELLKECPQIGDQINQFAANRVEFFRKKPEKSSTTAGTRKS
ncbi:TPA: phage tail assembly chaperone [Salmonella enterica subsp. enterica serovar Kottbus]